MADKHSICVLLQIDTTDPRLSLEAIEALQTAGDWARMRRVILQHLPRDVGRVIVAMPVNQARLLMKLHEAVGEDIAKKLREEGIDMTGPDFVRPPPGYVPPTTE
jgi:hypothetical protein